jgi:ABC-2 type transport system ATP-binding protein
MVGERTSPRETGTGSPLVRARSLSKRYGRQRALRGIDLDIRSGEIYGLIGPDGAGKSSLMKAVAGVLTFDAGSLEVFGIQIDSERAAERIKDRIGFMPQGLGQNLYPELSVQENIDFFAHSRLVPQEAVAERKERLLEMTRLGPFRDRSMKNLSGGMKQKLGLICTLIHNPRLVILDEPTTGVDPLSRRDFWAILSLLLREADITAIVSTAYLDEASRFHRLSLFFDGRVVTQGTPEDISAGLKGSVVSLRAEQQAETLAALRERFLEVEVRGSRLRVFVKGAGEEEAASLVREALDSIGEEAAPLCTGVPELEDVFIALLRERKLLAEEHLPRGQPPDSAPPPHCNDSGEGGTVIEANNLMRDFGGFRAVDGVSFRIAHGEIFGLLGANGAGKTTVIKMLVGLVEPTGGNGRVAGHGMLHASRDIRERIGYMSQVFSLYGDLTVVENIKLYAGIYGLERRETRRRTGWIIEMAGLSGHEDHQTAGLPVGVRQRLALGCALVHRPRILFLDEPTSGVDPLGRRRFWDVLFRLSRHEGVALLITTHAMSEAEHCDRLALMYAGRIVDDGSPGEMTRRLEAEMGRILEVSTDRPLEALDFLQRAGLEGVTLHGRQIHLPAADSRVMECRVREILDGTGVGLFGMTQQPLTMEDVFVHRVSALERNRRSTP